jgi:hypothetical protein
MDVFALPVYVLLSKAEALRRADNFSRESRNVCVWEINVWWRILSLTAKVKHATMYCLKQILFISAFFQFLLLNIQIIDLDNS